MSNESINMLVGRIKELEAKLKARTVKCKWVENSLLTALLICGPLGTPDKDLFILASYVYNDVKKKVSIDLLCRGFVYPSNIRTGKMRTEEEVNKYIIDTLAEIGIKVELTADGHGGEDE